jgi:hypothetical protein
MIKKKTYMINYILIKQLWLEVNIILIKNVQKWVDEKMLKNPMKKKMVFYKYQRTKVQKVGSPKNELINYIKWKPKTISLSTMSCLTE